MNNNAGRLWGAFAGAAALVTGLATATLGAMLLYCVIDWD